MISTKKNKHGTMAVLMLLHASEKWALNRTDQRQEKAEIK
jgi:hypothetical protein